jgi:hypothetical protein
LGPEGITDFDNLKRIKKASKKKKRFTIQCGCRIEEIIFK